VEFPCTAPALDQQSENVGDATGLERGARAAGAAAARNREVVDDCRRIEQREPRAREDDQPELYDREENRVRQRDDQRVAPQDVVQPQHEQ
jgi:hypothetical protein